MAEVVKKLQKGKKPIQEVSGAISRPRTRATIACLATHQAKRYRIVEETKDHSLALDEVEPEVNEPQSARAKRVQIEVKKIDFVDRELLVEKCFDEEQELILEFIKSQLLKHGWETLFAPLNTFMRNRWNFMLPFTP